MPISTLDMSDQIHDAIVCETSCTEPLFLAALFRTSSPNAKKKKIIIIIIISRHRFIRSLEITSHYMIIVSSCNDSP